MQLLISKSCAYDTHVESQLVVQQLRSKMQMLVTMSSSFESQLGESALPVVHGECEHVPMSSVQFVLFV